MSDYSDLPSEVSQPTCPECNGRLNRIIDESSTANRSEHRLVGGQNRDVVQECRKCDWTSGPTYGSTGDVDWEPGRSKKTSTSSKKSDSSDGPAPADTVDVDVEALFDK